jgi:N-methylhydantoinase A/oxoprolinase/acetone carboxylase beta subunit/N-methylhydantoinase B/oxoprolinase/acetone carboxylase alpha subunit
MQSGPQFRIGVDTGGTFTDVVAIRSTDGMIFSSKVPSTPSDPSIALQSAIREILRKAVSPPEEVHTFVHGTTVATNALLEREDHNMGLIVNEGFRFLLEIARQSVPDGYGNSFFWVKPPRLVPVDRVLEVRGRMDFRGRELRPLDERTVARAARRLRRMGVAAVGVCLLHSYANPAHEIRVREIIREEFPGCCVSLSSEVLPEYQEYERALATLMDAACKPVIQKYIERAGRGLAEALTPRTPFLVMKSNGGVMSAQVIIDRPITTALSGPAAGALAGAAIATAAGLSKVITLDAGGTSTDVSVIEGGKPRYTTSARLGHYPVKVPMIDIVTVGTGGGSIAWVNPEGRLRVGPRSAGADPGPMCYGKGGSEPTVTDAELILGRLPAGLVGGGIPLDRSRSEEGIRRLAGLQGLSPEEAARGIIEVAVWNQALAIRQMTVNRGKDPREYSLLAFGGAGPLMAADIAEVLAIREVVVPAEPGCGSAAGLVEVDLRNDYVRTHIVRLDEARPGELERDFQGMEAEARADLAKEEIPPARRRFLRSADMRYLGEGQEMTVELPSEGDFSRSLASAVASFHEAYRAQFGFNYKDRTPVEVVNLRLTAVGELERHAWSKIGAGSGPECARKSGRLVHFAGRGRVPTPIYDRGLLGRGDKIHGPSIIEEFGSTTVVPPGAACEVDEWGNLRIKLGPRAEIAPEEKTSPVVQEIVEGALYAAEREMEDLVERTARSPLIRDMHDYRVGLFDVKGRKLTGRSYSAVVTPVLKNWPPDEIREGDVFLWNDIYLSEGGIGHLPDLCSCVPIFHQGKLSAFALVFGHHDDVGGMVPGSLPTNATEVFQEGILVPPIKLYDRGVRNDTVYKVIFRNSRLGDHLQADIDAEIAACRAGGARLVELFDRFGRETVANCFEALLDKCERTMREELISKIKTGICEWEDYIESDGVEDGRRHALKLKMTKRDGHLHLDFRGTSPQAKGPINWPGDYANGDFLKKWIGPILRNLADTYDRMFEIDVNEGICRLIDIRFPGPGTLITPVFPAPTNMRTFTILRLLSLFCGVLGVATGGRMPADQETIRYWGIHGHGPGGKFFLFREILGGGSGGRPWGDGVDVIHVVPNSRNLPAEFSESRFPVLVERLALAPDSGGPGKRRGGLGYFKEFRILCDCEALSNADRSIIPPWGVNGGLAGGLYSLTLNPGTSREKAVPALSNRVPVRRGDILRVVTTGGGGWGDPLERETELVRQDVLWGKVTPEGARLDYGVVIGQGEDAAVDIAATEKLRSLLKKKRGRKRPFFDRTVRAVTLKPRAARRAAAKRGRAQR